MEKHIKVPMTREEAKQLKAGDYVYLTGTIYTARDAAHKRMQETLTAGKELPISIDGTIIYYMGPSPAREGRPIGSAGPTTASRMDKYAPQLLDLGLLGMIGKGAGAARSKKQSCAMELFTLLRLAERAHYYPNPSGKQRLLHMKTLAQKQSAS